MNNSLMFKYIDEELSVLELWINQIYETFSIKSLSS